MITKDMLIEDLVEEYPQLVGPLKVEGIVCLACGEPVWGTLEEQAAEKGLTNIDDIVERMNAMLDSVDSNEKTQSSGPRINVDPAKLS